MDYYNIIRNHEKYEDDIFADYIAISNAPNFYQTFDNYIEILCNSFSKISNNIYETTYKKFNILLKNIPAHRIDHFNVLVWWLVEHINVPLDRIIDIINKHLINCIFIDRTNNKIKEIYITKVLKDKVMTQLLYRTAMCNKCYKSLHTTDLYSLCGKHLSYYRSDIQKLKPTIMQYHTTYNIECTDMLSQYELKYLENRTTTTLYKKKYKQYTTHFRPEINNIIDNFIGRQKIEDMSFDCDISEDYVLNAFYTDNMYLLSDIQYMLYVTNNEKINNKLIEYEWANIKRNISPDDVYRIVCLSLRHPSCFDDINNVYKVFRLITLECLPIAKNIY